MFLVLNLLLGAAFAAAVAGSVHLWRGHMATARLDDLQALAARRGWSLSVTEERLGRTGALRIAPRGGVPWTARTQAGAGTDFESAEPRWADGTLVALPVDGPVDGTAPPDLPRLLGPDAARLTGALARVDSPPGLLVLADGDPRLRLPLDDLARIMGQWRRAGDPRMVPVLTLGPDGLRLRLRHRISRADHMERFIDLAQEASRLIGP